MSRGGGLGTISINAKIASTRSDTTGLNDSECSADGHLTLK